VIIAGGTGLYIKALLNGLDELPDPSPEVRARWQAVLERDGTEGLRLALGARNPAWLHGLADPSNSRRLMRALELIESGFPDPPRSWDSRASHSARVTGMDVPREVLVKRIEHRVYEMYEAGLLDETQSLITRYGALSVTASGAIGYSEALRCLQGELTRAAAIQLTIQRTRQLAKRQMTWFRHQMNVSWVTMAGSDFEAAATGIAADWQRLGPQPVIC
jgi:tRNA dimethylallyltransferase